MCEDPGLNPTTHGGVFHDSHCWYKLHTFTAVSRSTWPFTVCGMLKCVSFFGLSSNEWGGAVAEWLAC